jgi:hypothetical protein
MQLKRLIYCLNSFFDSSHGNSEAQDSTSLLHQSHVLQSITNQRKSCPSFEPLVGEEIEDEEFALLFENISMYTKRLLLPI